MRPCRPPPEAIFGVQLRAVRRHAAAEPRQDVVVRDVDPVADRQRIDGPLGQLPCRHGWCSGPPV
jgi:hypothetical protein